MAHKLENNNRAKDKWTANKTFKVYNDAYSLSDERYQLQSNEANYIDLNAGIKVRASCILAYQSTQFHMAATPEACENVTMAGGALNSARNPLLAD